MKKIILINDKKAKIKLAKEYIEIIKSSENIVVAKKFIKELYINRDVKIPITIFIELLKIAPIYFIDHNGYVKAELKEPTDEEIWFYYKLRYSQYKTAS